jgi:hypothetical protein
VKRGTNRQDAKVAKKGKKINHRGTEGAEESQQKKEKIGYEISPRQIDEGMMG